MTDASLDPILTVTQLNQQVRFLLEQSFPMILVEGEISNFVCPASGHWYFSLKDQSAQVRCAMFGRSNRSVKFAVRDGLQVLVKAKVGLYEGRGDYQLIIDSMEEVGAGALQKKFEELKAKLEKEGLFDDKHKQELPYIPNQIGVITSSTGAAVRDILKVLHRRFPSIPVIIYPTLVQGDQAAEQIVKAIETANQRKECDVLVLGRGGGSLEDLWPFNEEIVARSIFKSKLPIITGIGHQIDFTIADFVADVRAATPSAAAEMVAPSQEDIQQTILAYLQTMYDIIMHQCEQLTLHIDHLAKRLKQAHPEKMIAAQKERLGFLSKQLLQQINIHIHHKKAQFQELARALNTVSPLATLDRGYSITRNAKTQKVIRKKSDIKVNDKIAIKLAKLEVDCTVDHIK